MSKFPSLAKATGPKPGATPVASPAAQPAAGAPASPGALSVEQLQAQIAALQAKMAPAQAADVTPQPEKVPLRPAVLAERTVETEPDMPGVITETQQSHALAIFGANGPASALAAFCEAADDGGGVANFPVIQLTGGSTGGNFAVPQWVEKKFGMQVADTLSKQGRKLEGVFLGYRLEISAWPRQYDEAATERPKPIYTVAVGPNNVAEVKLATRACRAYQYTKKADKERFDADVAGTGAGHPKPVVQILLYVPGLGPISVQAPAHYNSAERTLKHLARNVDAATGVLQSFAVTLRPVTTAESNAANSWKVHHLEFDPNVKADGMANWNDFRNWAVNVLPKDPEAQGKIREFLDCTDRPMTADIQTSLQQAAGK